MPAVLIIISTLVALLVTIGYFYMKNAFLHWKRRGIPFAKPKFPFGNFSAMFLQRLSVAECVTQLYNSSSESVLGVFVAMQPSLIVRDPKILRDIFIKDFSSFYSRGTDPNIGDPMANNLLLQNGEQWRKNRQLLTPAFSSGKLKAMFDTIVACGSSLHKHIDQFAKSGKSVEIRDVFARYATNVIIFCANVE